ncbi:hypothetical protein RFI_18765, partial [Reticulomyxa filosa]
MLSRLQLKLSTCYHTQQLHFSHGGRKGVYYGPCFIDNTDQLCEHLAHLKQALHLFKRHGSDIFIRTTKTTTTTTTTMASRPFLSLSSSSSSSSSSSLLMPPPLPRKRKLPSSIADDMVYQLDDEYVDELAATLVHYNVQMSLICAHQRMSATWKELVQNVYVCCPRTLGLNLHAFTATPRFVPLYELLYPLTISHTMNGDVNDDGSGDNDNDDDDDDDDDHDDDHDNRDDNGDNKGNNSNDGNRGTSLSRGLWAVQANIDAVVSHHPVRGTLDTMSSPSTKRSEDVYIRYRHHRRPPPSSSSSSSSAISTQWYERAKEKLAQSLFYYENEYYSFTDLACCSYNTLLSLPLSPSEVSHRYLLVFVDHLTATLHARFQAIPDTLIPSIASKLREEDADEIDIDKLAHSMQPYLYASNILRDLFVYITAPTEEEKTLESELLKTENSSENKRKSKRKKNKEKEEEKRKEEEKEKSKEEKAKIKSYLVQSVQFQYFLNKVAACIEIVSQFGWQLRQWEALEKPELQHAVTVTILYYYYCFLFLLRERKGLQFYLFFFLIKNKNKKKKRVSSEAKRQKITTANIEEEETPKRLELSTIDQIIESLLSGCMSLIRYITRSLSLNGIRVQALEQSKQWTEISEKISELTPSVANKKDQDNAWRNTSKSCRSLLHVLCTSSSHLLLYHESSVSKCIFPYLLRCTPTKDYLSWPCFREHFFLEKMAKEFVRISNQAVVASFQVYTHIDLLKQELDRLDRLERKGDYPTLNASASSSKRAHIAEDIQLFYHALHQNHVIATHMLLQLFQCFSALATNSWKGALSVIQCNLFHHLIQCTLLKSIKKKKKGEFASPYLEYSEENPRHELWCNIIELIADLLRRAPQYLPKLQASSIDISKPSQQQLQVLATFYDHVGQFYLTFHPQIQHFMNKAA